MKTESNTLVLYTWSCTILTIATVASNTAVIRWLSPGDMGIWATLTLLQSYLTFVDCGLYGALAREYPFCLGRGDMVRAQKLASTAFVCTIVFAAFVLLLFFGYSWCFTRQGKWLLGSLCIGVGAAVLLYENYLQVIYRGSHNFLTLGKVHLFHSCFLAASVPLVAWCGFGGLCLRFVAVNCSVAAVMHWYRPVRATTSFDWRALRTLVATGVPLKALFYPLVLSQGFSRVILLQHGGVSVVGLFAPALAAVGAMQSLPAALNSYLAPSLSARYGRTNSRRALWGTTWRASIAVSLVLAVLVAVGWWLVPPLFHGLFPAYASSIPAAQLMMVSGIFLGIEAGTAVLVSMKRWLFIAAYSAVAVFLRWFIPSRFATGEADELLHNLAVGWIVSNAVLFVCGLALLYLATKDETAPGRGRK